ncbi:MAG: 1,4-alpha-glucan branching enzyme, partial [Actinomycetes bacterium]|nr:1,4-alpha-glucan branching enzyme [Actinomycetes bacterium]
MAKHVDPAVLEDIARGMHHDPHSVLGPHPGPTGTTIRVLRPLADSVEIETLDGRIEASHEHQGVWLAVVPGDQVPDYRIHTTYGDHTGVSDDPYRFLPLLGELDLHLIREGRHERLWNALGANVRRLDSVLGDVVGTDFAVWAPNARAVRVVGEFNHWQGATHAMRSLGASGIWELFIPGVEAGTVYKYEILDRNGHWRQKADPMARRTEVPPATASVVDESAYAWGDDAWMKERVGTQHHRAPMSVYEVHLGSWRQGMTYRELA